MIPVESVEAACNYSCNYICHRCGWCSCNPKEHWRMTHTAWIRGGENG